VEQRDSDSDRGVHRLDLDYYSSCCPNSIVNISGGVEQRFIEFNQVCRFFSSGVLYRLSDDPAALVKEDRPIMDFCAQSQFERPALGVHLRDRFDVGGYLVGEDADCCAPRNLVDVQVKNLLVEIGIDNEDLPSSRHNEGTQVAIKSVLFAGFIHALDFFFRKLQPEYADQTPQQSIIFSEITASMLRWLDQASPLPASDTNRSPPSRLSSTPISDGARA
jgi:hypothetical protein